MNVEILYRVISDAPFSGLNPLFCQVSPVTIRAVRESFFLS
jgi:hypothetical protein